MIRNQRLTMVAACLLLLAAATAPALVVEDGNIRLTLHEDSARFTVEVREGSDWTPLFYGEDPRTSSLDVLEGNRIHRIGDSGDFSQTVEQTAGGAAYTFESSTLRIAQSFRFTRSSDSATSNALEMRVTVTNLGEAPQVSGVRMVYDTYLGESSNYHFQNSAGQQVGGESNLDPGTINQYVRSVAGADAGAGFQLMLTGTAVTSPESVVVANWQRLSESSWQYQVNPTRNFNRLPYSINDSALLIAYPTVQLVKDQSATFVSYLGDLADGGYLDPNSAAPVVEAPSIDRDALLVELASLIERITEAASSDTVSAEEIEELRQRLEAIRTQIRGQ